MASTIAARDLRNDSAAILRRANAGEEFVVTSNGIPVARVVPLNQARGLRASRPAHRTGALSAPTHVPVRPLSELLAADREDRV